MCIVTPLEMGLRQCVAACIGHAGMSARLKLMPSREAKLNGIIDRQEVILRGLAFLLDEVVAAESGRREIQFTAVPENSAGPEKRIEVAG